ncbi:MAG: hypothetical protein IE931_09830 [Sphingobacteriales bacterium]|nr:hypothetical protein [Sphingobacteriales bacterium]
MKVLKITLVLFILLSPLFVSKASKAQCAMCQATVESNLKGGGSTGKSLNAGIVYLLIAPYIAMVGIGFLWYKKYRKKDVVIDIKSEKINLN